MTGSTSTKGICCLRMYVVTIHKDWLLRIMQNDDIQTHSLRTIRVIGLEWSVLVGINSMKYTKFVEAWLSI